MLAGGDYLEYINLLNQLMMMATQLHNDALDPRNHKYAAHQVAILYVRAPKPPIPTRTHCPRGPALSVRWSCVAVLGSWLAGWLAG